MLRRTSRYLSAAEASVSFASAPGFSQAAKSALVTRSGADLPFEQVPVYVVPEFISQSEEQALLKWTSAMFERLPFATGHYDELIEHYKEFYRPWRILTDPKLGLVELDDLPGVNNDEERANHKRQILEALQRCRNEAQTFVPATPLQDRVHFLQLESHGFIRAHADEQRNSSALVAGLTLGSGRVMTLTHTKAVDVRIEMLLAPRSMYILAGAARNEWLHSVDWTGTSDFQAPVADSAVMFAGRDTGLTRRRRTAIIFRGMSPMELFMDRMKNRREEQA
jgi:hypothetical protein